MKVELIKNTLSRYFDEVENLKEDDCIFECKKYFNENIYQIYYVDCSQKWKLEFFNIEEYLEKYISNNYYTNPGSIQWNFYLVMLYDSQIMDTHLKRKVEEIERNESYCRKYVINENQLDNWLERKYKIKIEKDEEINEDLAALWISKLHASDLDCVYLDDIKYVEGINAIINGTPLKQNDRNEEISDTKIKIERNKEPENTMKQIPQIRELIIHNYRKFPTIRNFKFGKVNLFTGQNGTGKTSILEAIELLLCGKNYRNQNAENCEAIITAYFEGYDEEFSNNLENKIYKKRNEFWYNKPQNNGTNRLCVDFNKYNFFNTDAAFEFASEKKNEGNINKAFENIALGDNVNFIENRMLGYQERLKKESAEIKKFISDYEKVIDYENETLKNTNYNKANLILLFDKFIQDAKDIHWNGNLPQDFSSDFSDFENDYIKIENTINILINNVAWINQLTSSSIQSEAIIVSNTIGCYKYHQKKVYELKSELSDVERDINKVSSTIKKLERYRLYEEKEINNKLIGINERITKLNSFKMLFTECISQLNECDLNCLPNSNDYINSFFKKLEENLKSHKIKFIETKIKVENLKKSLSQFEGIIAEIKAMGKQALSINSNLSKCPLCNTLYSNDELHKRIEEVYTTIENVEILEKYVKEVESLKRVIDKLEKQFITIDIINQVLYKLKDVTNKDDISMKEVLSYIDYIKVKSKNVETEYTRLLMIKEQSIEDGFSEEEYIELRRQLNVLGITDIPVSESIYKYETELKMLLEKKNNHLNKIYFEEKEINDLAQSYLKSSNNDKFDVLLMDRDEKLRNSIILLDSIKEYLTLKNEDNIWFKYKCIKELYKLFSKFKYEKDQSNKNDFIKNKSLNVIRKYQLKLDEKMEIFNRVEKSLNAINDILENHGKSSYLKEFINNNIEKIVEIFREIHSPNEFNDIYFEENSNIKLKRADNGEIANLKSISTGQRSALALAVFLCLNQKLKNGPPYLIFDDPIAFIDDLNILSFIDYIREMVISTDRQVFFATANENLSFLIQQKFSFFDDSNFKVYKFDRQDKAT